MKRRTVLRTTGAIAATLAGCLSSDGEGATGGTEQPGASDADLLTVGESARGPMEDDPSAEWRVSVRDTFAQTSAFVNSNEPQNKFVDASSHLLFAEIGARLPDNYVGSYTVPYDLPGTFTAVVNGTESDPTDSPVRADDDLGGFAGYAFDVDPGEEVSEAIVRWSVADRTHEWAVDRSARDQLVTRPRAGNVTLSVPEEAVDGDTVTVELAAENVGEDDGRIRAGFYRRWNQNVRRFSASVPAGESHTWTATIDARSSIGFRDYEFFAVTASGVRDIATTRVFGTDS